MRVFQDHGIAIGRADMRDAFMEFYRRRKAAVLKLAAVYTPMLEACLKAGDVDRSARLRTTLADLQMPGKLVSLRLLRRENDYVQHADYLGKVEPAIGEERLFNATFELLPGLSNPDNVSFRSLNCDGFYLCHGDFRVRIGPCDNTKASRENSTFKQVKGLASEAGVSFEAVNWPGYYIRAKGRNLYLEKQDRDRQFHEDATFVIAEPRCRAW
jgi:hypothetical protein